ncbi:hypothetical protein L6452_18204 [Arctium lappa]|uniref:Uncharacterized protein n=1 Tax=Arctium lappa TaxID=4217 RepID=A0ACB9C5V3_ARCLA|nr:hypothetical protein L6452_18204 [Arctium lappa]
MMIKGQTADITSGNASEKKPVALAFRLVHTACRSNADERIMVVVHSGTVMENGMGTWGGGLDGAGER